MRKLGLDLGTKTCGIAISDDNNIIASGKSNFHYSDNDFFQIIDEIKKIIDQYQNSVDEIVLGYPTNVYDGSKNARTILVEEFNELLIDAFPKLKITLSDERFTTRIATAYLKAANVKAAKRKKVKDKMSAVVILQDYINNLK